MPTCHLYGWCSGRRTVLPEPVEVRLDLDAVAGGRPRRAAVQPQPADLLVRVAAASRVVGSVEQCPGPAAGKGLACAEAAERPGQGLAVPAVVGEDG